MRCLKNESIKVYADIIDYVLKKQDESRIISNPTLDNEKYDMYYSALKLCISVFPPEEGKVTAEDPTIPYESHSIVINLKDDDFDGDRYKRFVELLSKFDGLSFIYNRDELTIILQLCGIYH